MCGPAVVSELGVEDREISSAVTWGWAALMCHQGHPRPVQRCEWRFILTNVVQHWTEKDTREGVRAIGLRATDSAFLCMRRRESGNERVKALKGRHRVPDVVWNALHTRSSR